MEIWVSWSVSCLLFFHRSWSGRADLRVERNGNRVFFWNYMRGKPGTSSKDVNGFDHRLEAAYVPPSIPLRPFEEHKSKSNG